VLLSLYLFSTAQVLKIAWVIIVLSNKSSILRLRLFLYLENAALPYPEYSEEDSNLGGGVGELHIRHRHSYTLTARDSPTTDKYFFTDLNWSHAAF
jgi:hypothetical protein